MLGIEIRDLLNKGNISMDLKKTFIMYFMGNSSSDNCLTFLNNILSKLPMKKRSLRLSIQNKKFTIAEGIHNLAAFGSKTTDYDGISTNWSYQLSYQCKILWCKVAGILEECILGGANINAISKDGYSLSRLAIKTNKCIDFLNTINWQFAYAWPKDNFNRTDLQYTIIKKKEEYFHWLIENSPQFSSIDIDGNTCIHTAVIHTPDFDYQNESWKSSYIVKILEKCHHRLLYVKNKANKSALDLARNENKPNMVQLLEELMDEEMMLKDYEFFDVFRIQESFNCFLFLGMEVWMMLSYFQYCDLETKKEDWMIKTNKYCRDEYGRIFLHYGVLLKDERKVNDIYKNDLKEFFKRDMYGHTPLAIAGVLNNEIYLNYCNKVENVCGKATFYILQKETDYFKSQYELLKLFTNKYEQKNINVFLPTTVQKYLCTFDEEILIKLYTLIVVNSKKLEYYNSPIQMAIQSYNYQCNDSWLTLVKSLIDLGVDVHIKTIDGGSLLHLAVEQRNSEILYRFLLGQGVNINDADNHGKTAIHYLLEKQEYKNLEMLLNCGNIETEDKNGDTYLHYFAKYMFDGFQVMPEIQILFNEKLMKKNKDGKTPLHIASELGKCSMFEAFLQICPKHLVIAYDKSGKTAYDYAAENGHYNILCSSIIRYCENIDNNFLKLYFPLISNNQVLSSAFSANQVKKKFLSIGQSDSNFSNSPELFLLFDEFSICGISVPPEIEVNIQNALLDAELTLIDKNKIPNTHEEECVEKTKVQILFLIEIIMETIKQISKSDHIHAELYQKILQISVNIRQLKNKLKQDFNLPWQKMEFILVSYLSIYSYHNESDSFVYKLILNKKRIGKLLEIFVNGLNKNKELIFLMLSPKTNVTNELLDELQKEINLLQKMIKKKPEVLDDIRAKIYELKKLIDDPIDKRENMPTIEIITNVKYNEIDEVFEAIRTFYSLSQILRYVNESVAVDVRNNELGTLVIQRAIQVFGEYIKDSPDSPNVSKNINNAILCETKYLKDCLVKIRNAFSHTGHMDSPFDNQSNIEFYINIQNDLRHLRSFLIKLLYDEREQCISKFVRRMLDSKTKETLKDLCIHFTKGCNITEDKPFNKIKVLVQHLNEILIYKTSDEEIYFSKIDNIIQKANVNVYSKPEYNFGNPETFLLKINDKACRDQTIYDLFGSSSDAPKKSDEQLQPIAFFILQIQKIVETRLFPNRKEDLVKIHNICNEIFATSFIGVKQKIEEQIDNENSEKFKSQLLQEINDYLKYSATKIPGFRDELEKYKKINDIFTKLKSLVGIENKSNSQLQELELTLNDYKIAFNRKTLEPKLKTNQALIIRMQNQEDQYFNLLENSFRKKSVMKSLQKFINNFKSFENYKKKELKKCFMEYINKFKLLFPDESKYLQHLKNPNVCLTMAIETIVYKLFAILKDFEMLVENDNVLESYPPLVSMINLKNYLAHGDALFDILPFKTEISVFINGLKLVKIINELEMNTFFEDKILLYKSTSNLSAFDKDRYHLKKTAIRKASITIDIAKKCSPFGILFYFYEIPILRGVDLQGRTIFNLLFENNPKSIVNFFMDKNKRIIRNPKSIEVLTKVLNIPNTMNIESLEKYLVNQLFVLDKRDEIIILLLKICTLHGYHSEIDDICSDVSNENLDILLNKNYQVIMSFADQYSYVTNVQRYSRIYIPEYNNEYSLVHLAAAFNHLKVVQRLLNLENYEVNVTTKNMKTPLHVAECCGYKDMVNFLTENGANISNLEETDNL